MAATQKLIPNIKWAQRKDRVLITVDLQDVEGHKIDVTPQGHLTFSGKAHEKNYSLELDLFAEVDVENSKWNTKGRNIIMVISKKDKESEHWPRLTSSKEKNAHIQFDWSMWVDEDEEGKEEDGEKGWDPSMMNAMGGMGGMGGMPGMGGMGMPGMGDMMGGMGGMEGYDDEDDEDDEQNEGKPDLGDLDEDEDKLKSGEGLNGKDEHKQ